jgi:two-component system, OmpR family, sensor histidine kinase KdpD
MLRTSRRPSPSAGENAGLCPLPRNGGGEGKYADEEQRNARGEAPRATDFWSRLPAPLVGTRRFAAAIAIAAIATALSALLSLWLPHQSLALVYLLFVVLGAIGLGTGTGLTTAILSFLAYNFFFIPPVFTFVVAERQELFALIVFFAIALLTGSVAGRMREAADAARRRETAMLSLNDFAGALSGVTSTAAILEAFAAQAAVTVQGAAIVLLKASDDLVRAASIPPELALEPVDWQAALRASRSGEIAPAAAPGGSGAALEFRPLTTRQGTIGVIGLAPADGRRTVAADAEPALQTVIRHTLIALERTHLEVEGARVRDEAERERIRSALLSSLSHDLKTPLASILGAVTTLRQLGASLPADTRADLLAAIEEESGRLARFVANLLDLTRLETASLDLRRDWIDVADAAQLAVVRARQQLQAASISFATTTRTAIIRGDAMLCETVVFNLIDNAVKFSGPALPVRVELSAEPGMVIVTVTDQGPGIPAEQLERVFEKFYRGRERDREASGTGLGLTICRRVVEGMGGTIRVESPAAGSRGTRVVVQLPSPPQEPRP